MEQKYDFDLEHSSRGKTLKIKLRFRFIMVAVVVVIGMFKGIGVPTVLGSIGTAIREIRLISQRKSGMTHE